MMFPKMLIASSPLDLAASTTVAVRGSPRPRNGPRHRHVLAVLEERNMQTKFLVLLAGSALALAACSKHDNAKVSGDTGNATELNMAASNGTEANASAPSPLTAQGFV